MARARWHLPGLLVHGAVALAVALTGAGGPAGPEPVPAAAVTGAVQAAGVTTGAPPARLDGTPAAPSVPPADPAPQILALPPPPVLAPPGAVLAPAPAGRGPERELAPIDTRGARAPPALS